MKFKDFTKQPASPRKKMIMLILIGLMVGFALVVWDGNNDKEKGLNEPDQKIEKPKNLDLTPPQ